MIRDLNGIAADIPPEKLPDGRLDPPVRASSMVNIEGCATFLGIELTLLTKADLPTHFLSRYDIVTIIYMPSKNGLEG